MRLRPHHIALIVSDLEASRSFYRALGFKAGDEMDVGTAIIAFMHSGGLELELFCYRDTPPAVAEERVLGFRHLALTTRDVDRALAKLQADGIVPHDVVVRDVGFARLAFFPDPDGAEIEIVEYT